MRGMTSLPKDNLVPRIGLFVKDSRLQGKGSHGNSDIHIQNHGGNNCSSKCDMMILKANSDAGYCSCAFSLMLLRCSAGISGEIRASFQIRMFT